MSHDLEMMLGELSSDARNAALALSIVKDDPGALNSIIVLTNLIVLMATTMPTTARFAIAEALRDAADGTEHRRVLLS